MNKTILVIEDDPHVLEVLRALLVRRGYEVLTAADGRAGVACIERSPVDLVITDVLMPDIDGIETIALIRKTNPTLPVIAMSGGHQIEPEYYLRLATALGAARGLLKPFAAAELYSCVEAVLAQPV
jgi:DNA-binding response OmpR family regulator